MRVSGNGRYLVDDTGQPFFYLADTAWALFYRPTREEADLYLRNRAAKGFTVVMPVVLWAEDMAGRNAYGEAPLVDWDPTRPNERFFRHVDHVVDAAAALGLHVAMLPTWGEFVGPLWTGDRPSPSFSPTGKGPVIFDPESARVYGEFLGRRYRDRPVFWVLGGDRNPVNAEYVAVWCAMAQGLAAGDGGRHLMTYHPCGVNSSSRWFHEEPWLDFHMMQTTTRWDLDNYNLILADYDRVPAKPVLDGETRYEDSYEWFSKKPPCGRRVTPHQVRKAAYNAMLSGAMGHTYGCRDVWFFYVPADEPPRKDVKTHWKRAMDLPGAFQMGHLRRLLTDCAWYKLVPERENRLVVHGCGEGAAYTPAARSADGDLALVYVPERMPIWVDLGQLAGDRVTALWFDPCSGAYVWAGEYEAAGVERFDVPVDVAEPDHVLVLRVSE